MMKLNAAAEYPYTIISNCLAFDTNAAPRVVFALWDYERVKDENTLLREVDASNRQALADCGRAIHTAATNATQPTPPSGVVPIAESLKIFGKGAAAGAAVILVAEIIIYFGVPHATH